jgi:hypothetical protein
MTRARPADPPGSGDAFGAHLRHASHDALFTPVTPAGQGTIDVVIVPTARDTQSLTDALLLAKALGCPLVALCSVEAKRSAVVQLADELEAEAIAVDTRTASLPIELTAGKVAAGVAPGGKYVDLSFKRNVGLALARMVAGWQRVLFLDDDITDVSVPDLRAAAARLHEYTAIGLDLAGKPDNSVVCHAFRDVGRPQSTFVGGGAMLIPAGGDLSHFPDIYNEDWFFLLGEERLGPVGRMGRARQRDYDPYDDAERARAQEFGDCLAEGVFALLDAGREVREADLSYWGEYLLRRRLLIDDVMAELPAAIADPGLRKRMTASLTVAAETLACIDPRHCVEFLDAWRRDRRRWREFLRGLPSVELSVDALAHLGLGEVSHTRVL